MTQRKPAGFGKRRSEEAQQRHDAQKQRTLIGYTLAGVAALALLFALSYWFSSRPAGETAATTATATPPVAGPTAALTPPFDRRPLSELDPLSRVNFYSAAPDMVIDPDRQYEATIVTDRGEMRFRLYADRAPLTVNNFVFLANEGFYDGLTFHRVMADFMAQGGDPSGSGSGGPGYRFADETDSSLSFNRRGLLAMANAGPNTNGSQFFITFKDTSWLDGNHTIFGELISGDSVLAAIRLRDPATDPLPGDTIHWIEISETP